ncbi:hypothetical protein Lal_00034328 [Lupinus albus]|nr:hypothetical protein Lal_00034328 [Lupinus albus]
MDKSPRKRFGKGLYTGFGIGLNGHLKTGFSSKYPLDLASSSSSTFRSSVTESDDKVQGNTKAHKFIATGHTRRESVRQNKSESKTKCGGIQLLEE